ncbi:MAG: hypothetical protein ABSF15_17195 [Candidatus Sulfotelmatobacter sp.]|jgi:hypothetical protein
MTVNWLRQVKTFHGEGQLEDPDGHSIGVSYSLVEHEGKVGGGRENLNYTLLGNRTLEGTVHAGRLPLARECVLHLKDGFRIKVLLTASDGHVAHVDSTGSIF